jgi:ABC-type uncharacterized transport system involved in gliding motility auxiliary subunit
MSAAQTDSRTPLRRTAWPGVAGLTLLLVALARDSIDEVWDLWCTLAVAAGVLCLVVWSAGHSAQARRQARTRGVRYGSQALATSVLLLAILVLVNFVAARHNLRVDLTESGLFTLAPQTQQVLRSLKRDVRLLAFFPTGRRAQAAGLLQRYAAESRHVQYELIDPDQEPERARRYGVTAYGTVVVEIPSAADRPAAAAPPLRVEAEPAGKSGLALSEEKLTNALLKAERGSTKTIYFLEGHGEGDIASGEMNGYARLRSALEDQAYSVKTLFLARQPQVPSDCAALVIAGPGREPLPDEMAAIQRYLEQGGKALFLIDPAPAAGLNRFLDRWGMRVGNDLVVDVSGAGRIYGAGAAMPLVKDYHPQHPITHNFRQMTFFPLARSLAVKETPGDALVAPLAQTGPESFAEPYTGGSRHARFDPTHDRRGPIVLAVAATREATNGRQARLVVIGSSNFVTNSFFDKAGNGDFCLNSLHWLAEEEELIALRPRSRQDHRIQLTDQQARGIFWLVVVAMPLAAAGVGGVVLWRRR